MCTPGLRGWLRLQKPGLLPDQLYTDGSAWAGAAQLAKGEAELSAPEKIGVTIRHRCLGSAGVVRHPGLHPFLVLLRRRSQLPPLLLTSGYVLFTVNLFLVTAASWLMEFGCCWRKNLTGIADC